MAVRNVRIVSEDGSGFAGLQLGHANYSGVLVKHVEVEGFDHGLHIDSATGGMFAHVEDVKIRGQRVSGVTAGAISLSVRKLRTEDVPVGLTCTSPLGFTVLVDSTLNGTGPTGIDRRAGGLYVSNVTLGGFADARHIDESVHPAARVGNGGQSMARLPVEDTPVYQASGKATTGVWWFQGGVRCVAHGSLPSTMVRDGTGTVKTVRPPQKWRRARFSREDGLS